MQALKVRHFGGVTGFHQGFEAHLDQFNRTTAQHGLLAEQIGFGFFFEIGFDDASLAATVGHGIAQGQVAGFAALVLVHSHQMGHTAALGVGIANRVARRFRGHHPNIQIGAWHDLVVMHIEAVGKGQGSALLHVGRHVVVVNIGNLLIGQQHHDHVSRFDRVVDFHHVQASFADFVPGSASLAQTHHHFDAAVVQVLGVGMALRTIADDGHGFAFDQAQVTVFVVIDFHGFLLQCCVNIQTRNTRSPRPMPQAPVRTVSKIAAVSMACKKASFLSTSPVSSMV